MPYQGIMKNTRPSDLAVNSKASSASAAGMTKCMPLVNRHHSRPRSAVAVPFSGGVGACFLLVSCRLVFLCLFVLLVLRSPRPPTPDFYFHKKPPPRELRQNKTPPPPRQGAGNIGAGT